MISSNRIRQLKVIQNRVAFLYCIERNGFHEDYQMVGASYI
jgi:hypothetical protein